MPARILREVPNKRARILREASPAHSTAHTSQTGYSQIQDLSFTREIPTEGCIMKRRNQHLQRTKRKQRQPKRLRRNKPVAPRTAKEFFAMPERSQDRWTRVTHVVSKMRTDAVSLRQASREFGLDPRTVLRLSRPALRKRANGRYVAKGGDRLLRVLVVPTPEGLREVAMRDSRQASQLARYSAAVDRYLETGDDTALRKFRRKRITDASGTRIPLLTDLNELDRLGSAGVLSFESLYAGSR